MQSELKKSKPGDLLRGADGNARACVFLRERAAEQGRE
jgi:hypothetical protein